MAQKRLLPLLDDFEGYLATVPRCDRLQDRADRLDGMALLAYHQFLWPFSKRRRLLSVMLLSVVF